MIRAKFVSWKGTFGFVVPLASETVPDGMQHPAFCHFKALCEHLWGEEKPFLHIDVKRAEKGFMVDRGICDLCLEKDRENAKRPAAIARVKELFREGFRFQIEGCPFPNFYRDGMKLDVPTKALLEAAIEGALADFSDKEILTSAVAAAQRAFNYRTEL